MLGHKTGLNKFKKIEIIVSILTSHNDIKLEIHYKKMTLHMETKQHATKQSIVKSRIQIGNLKIP